MTVKFSKAFEKSVRKLSGKTLSAVIDMIRETIDAESINDISDCKKLVGYNSIYRIRKGDYRAFFVFHVEIENDIVMFQYFVSRGEAYDKKIKKTLRAKDI
jgi:mRNA-degrading endonuclease RelE of RelBE toxin-antitoxin system